MFSENNSVAYLVVAPLKSFIYKCTDEIGKYPKWVKVS